LQVHRNSKELSFSENSGQPYELDARKNAQRRSVVKLMRDPVRGRESPESPLNE
jgi:hypothetical protein